jgi:VanZ family protein
MNPFFGILSAAYIFGIFYWADSPAVSQIEVFNPYSLLHIPLYGILTFLLLRAVRSDSQDGFSSRLLIAGLIAGAVGALDEWHQSFIPMRDASFGDVLLDWGGIGIMIFLEAKKQVTSYRLRFTGHRLQVTRRKR